MTVDSDQHPAVWNGHTIRLLPGWQAWFAEGAFVGVGSVLELVEQPSDNGRIPDAYSDNVVSAEFYVYDENIRTVHEAAVACATAILSTVFHEVFEWVTVDGVRLADPHPESQKNWEWARNEMRSLVHEYIAEFPE